MAQKSYGWWKKNHNVVVMKTYDNTQTLEKNAFMSKKRLP